MRLIRQFLRQVFFPKGQRAAPGAVDDGDGLFPVALAGKHPVPERAVAFRRARPSRSRQSAITCRANCQERPIKKPELTHTLPLQPSGALPAQCRLK